MKHQVLIPFTLIVALLIVHWIVLAAACLNRFKLNFNAMIPGLILYCIVVIFLVVYTLVSEKADDAG